MSLNHQTPSAHHFFRHSFKVWKLPGIFYLNVTHPKTPGAHFYRRSAEDWKFFSVSTPVPKMWTPTCGLKTRRRCFLFRGGDNGGALHPAMFGRLAAHLLRLVEGHGRGPNVLNGQPCLGHAGLAALMGVGIAHDTLSAIAKLDMSATKYR